MWKDEVSRRTVLRLGMSAAAVLSMPLSFGRRAEAAGSPHFLVTFFADGGWDPTQTLDAHDPLDATDGIDVDVPGQPPSQITAVSGLTYMSNPVTRPTVDLFFNTWASRAAIVNGVNTRSTSHDQSTQLVLTGYLDPTRADFSVMSAHHNGPDLPLPHLLLSGPSFGGPFAGLSGRVGGQLGAALTYNRIPGHTDPEVQQLGVSALGEAYIQQALERERMHAAAGAVTGKLAAFREANTRGEQLARAAGSLPRNVGNGTQLATSLATAFRAGMSTSATVSTTGGFDTHSDNTQQNDRWERVFTFLNDFIAGLAAQPGIASASLLDETTVVYCSEFGRTPQLNGDLGKDHHPVTSMILVGKRVRGGSVLGGTDGDQEGVKVNFDTGRPDSTGQVIDVQNLVAGVMTLMGANANEYLPTVRPFNAIIGA